MSSETHASAGLQFLFLSAADPVSMPAVAQWLNQIPATGIQVDNPPRLAWSDDLLPAEQLAARFAHWLVPAGLKRIGDSSAAYLPQVPRLFEVLPDARFLHLELPIDQVVLHTLASLQRQYLVPTNHWAEETPVGWHRDPIRSRAYPKFPITDLEQGIRAFAQQCHELAAKWAETYPRQFRIVQTAEFESAAGQRGVCEFLGMETHSQPPEFRPIGPPQAGGVQGKGPQGNDPLDPKRCVILVPYSQHIVPECDTCLRQLEQRGYTVWRVGNVPNIDIGRSQMATDALVAGYDETLWIDSDMIFHVDDVERLRRHGLPICCGVYPKKQSPRVPACYPLPGSPLATFGTGGGLTEILYSATGFLHVRREVYLQMQEDLDLPICNDMFGQPLIPFFRSVLTPTELGTWWLGDDYAFCEQARQAGFKIIADTSILLKHVGAFPYFWEPMGATQS